MNGFRLALTVDFPPQRIVMLGMDADPGTVWTPPDPDHAVRLDAYGTPAQLADMLEAVVNQLRAVPAVPSAPAAEDAP